ncbi:hypothetical protein Ancab_040644 [Ancistrocladus abbreviatus]
MAHIQHPRHPHPLFESYKDGDGYFLGCPVCHHHIFGRVFGCQDCNFYLHRECAELPPELLHPLHPTHPLKLRPPRLGSSEHVISSCTLCHRRLDEILVYACDNDDNLCFAVGQFFMHPSCALLKPSKKHPLHEHPLVFVKEFDCLANCAACGTKIRDNDDEATDLYSCLECNIRIHQECVDTPKKSELEALTLQQCRSSMEIHNWLHHCPLHEITVNEGNITCVLCQSLVNGPAYGCEDCRFFLHQDCAKVPQQLLHPLHQFPLFISPILNGDEFVCDFCHLTIDLGYFYQCNGHCQFKMHVYCAALKPSSHHPRHEHLFVLVKEGRPLNSANCLACGADLCSSSDTPTSYYICWTCNISFHARCFDSPKVKDLDKHPHPLTLYFDPAPLNYEDKDYYCDYCEEKRDIHTYSYVCQVCESEDFNYICHIRCDLFNKPEVVIYEEKLKECARLIAEEEAALEEAQKHTKLLKAELSISQNKESLSEESLKKLKMQRDEIMEMIGRL